MNGSSTRKRKMKGLRALIMIFALMMVISAALIVIFSSSAAAVAEATPKDPSTVRTTLSADQITLGDFVTDYAAVTNLNGELPDPTGTIDFQVSFKGGNWVTYDPLKPLSPALMGVSATSIPYKPLAAGDYNFRAIYNGDSNFNGSMSVIDSEPLLVGPATSKTTTLLSSSSIIQGKSITDTVTVTGLGGKFPVPMGTVKFQVQIGTGPFNTFSTKTLSSIGKATSDAYKPLAVGSYHFRAIYSGDVNYKSSQSGNYDEPLKVCPYPTTTTTHLSAAGIKLGQCVTDKAFVSGSLCVPPYSAPTGTVTFFVKVPGGSFVQYGAVKNLVGGSATSGPYTPMVTGTYYFKAVYSGDRSYSSSASFDKSEPLIVSIPAGHTTGFWKENTAKHIAAYPANTVKGTQVTLDELKHYLWNIVQKYHVQFPDSSQWLDKIAPLGGSYTAVSKTNLMNAYTILNGCDSSNMIQKDRAQILSLFLTEQLRNAQSKANCGSPTAYSDAQVFIPKTITGANDFKGKMSAAIALIKCDYNSKNYVAAKNIAEYLNNASWKVGQPVCWK